MYFSYQQNRPRRRQQECLTLLTHGSEVTVPVPKYTSRHIRLYHRDMGLFSVYHIRFSKHLVDIFHWVMYMSFCFLGCRACGSRNLVYLTYLVYDSILYIFCNLTYLV